MAQTLATVRETIKTRIAIPFNFLDRNDKPLKLEKENDITLENIIAHNSINLKSIKENDFSIKIFLNGDNIISLNCSKKDNLNEIRNLINNKIQLNFIYLDEDGNSIDITDENDFLVEDIVKNDIINIVNIDTSNKINEIINNPELENKKEIDFSKYEIIKKHNYGFTFYKYSNIQSIKHSGGYINQYFYDDIEEEDLHAYIVLFCGIIGDGKTTTINAFFNIIKGVKLEDNYRFILISERRNQSKKQTEGIHLYYVRDYYNKPVILIDTEGIYDCSGYRRLEEKLFEELNYTFSNLIDHINVICFVSKSSDYRPFFYAKYFFFKLSNLFSEDIIKNFIFLTSFATRDTIKKGPAFIESSKNYDDFLNIQDRINEKFWYAFDSNSIFDDEIDKINKYSYSQLNEFYKEKVKNLKPKSIKNCSEQLKTRYELKVRVNIFKEIFKNLLIEYINLKEKEKNINDIFNKINNLEDKIMIFEKEKDSRNLTGKEKEEKIISFNNELDKLLNNLNNEYEEQIIKSYEKSEVLHTTCLDCKKNCHSPCNCYFKIFERCNIFSYGILNYKQCEICGCNINMHQTDYYYYNYNKNKIKNDNANKVIKEEGKNKFIKEINNKENNYEKQINILNYYKNKLLKEKERNIKEKKEIENKILEKFNQITSNLEGLKKTYKLIEDVLMDKNHIKNVYEFINSSLREKIEEIGIKGEEQEKIIKEMKDIIGN